MTASQQTETIKFLNRKLRQGAYKINDHKPRPNIILITVDMISPDCYHPSRELSRVIHTPNLDSIAQSGTRFDNAFTASPLCGPARASLFTGMHPPYLSNGERAPSGTIVDLEPSDIIFQDYLKAEGYVLKHVGKCHVGVEKFIGTFGENLHAWDRWGPPVMDDDRYLDYIDAMGIKEPVYKKELHGLQSNRIDKGNSFGGWIEQVDGSPFPLEAHYSTFLSELAIKQIKAAQRQAPNKPFFSQIDFFDPHQPFSIPDGLEERYKLIRQAITPPASFIRLIENNESPDNSIYRLYQKYWGIYDTETLIDYIAGHLLQVEVVDYGIGKIIQYLQANGLWDETAIIFTADHGEMNGRLGMADKGAYFQPDIFAVPLYIKPPANSPAPLKTSNELVSSLDIAPTILAYANMEKPAFMEGCDLFPVMLGDKRKTLKQVYQLGIHVGANLGIGFQTEIDGIQWFYGYNAATGYQELYQLTLDDQINRFYLQETSHIRQVVIQEAAELFSSDPRWFGYWASYRLHNMEYLPVQSGTDMQMLKPIER